MLWKTAEQSSSLSFAAGILVRGPFFLTFQNRVVAQPLTTILICDANVVNGLLNLCGKTLIVWMEKLKALAKEDPETAPAEFSKLLPQIVAVRRIFLKLDD